MFYFGNAPKINVRKKILLYFNLRLYSVYKDIDAEEIEMVTIRLLQIEYISLREATGIILIDDNISFKSCHRIFQSLNKQSLHWACVSSTLSKWFFIYIVRFLLGIICFLLEEWVEFIVRRWRCILLYNKIKHIQWGSIII